MNFGYCSCPSVSVRSFLPPRVSRSRNIDACVHRDTEKTFIIVIFAKNASFGSYGVRCHQTTDTKGIS